MSRAGYARRVVVVGLVVLLAACASVPRRSVDQGAALAALAQREAQAAAEPDWQFSGRIAVSAEGRGGSGSIDWQQRGDDLAIRVSAPVTRRSWRLSRVDGWTRLEGLEQGPAQGPDAEQLLREQVGWEVPLAQMSQWVRGLRARGEARVSFAADGLPARIEQGGWRVDYRGWDRFAGQSVPRKVFASRGGASVRLAIDRWQAPAGASLP